MNIITVDGSLKKRNSTTKEKSSRQCGIKRQAGITIQCTFEQ